MLDRLNSVLSMLRNAPWDAMTTVMVVVVLGPRRRGRLKNCVLDNRNSVLSMLRITPRDTMTTVMVGVVLGPRRPCQLQNCMFDELRSMVTMLCFLFCLCFCCCCSRSLAVCVLSLSLSLCIIPNRANRAQTYHAGHNPRAQWAVSTSGLNERGHIHRTPHTPHWGIILKENRRWRCKAERARARGRPLGGDVRVWHHSS